MARNKPPAAECARFNKILQTLPKTEIHLHLEALATVDTIWALMEKNHLIYDGITVKEDLARKYQIKTLDEFVQVFINIVQNSFKTESDFSYLLADTGVYLKENNIEYAEVFFAPSKFVRSGFDFEKMLQTLTDGAEAIARSCGAQLRYIIDVSRTFGPVNAMRNLELTLAHKSPAVIGIGLGGAEASGPAKDFEAVFQRAAEAGLHVVAHAGEDAGPHSIWDALNLLHVERIGHGVSALEDEELMNYLAKHQIPLEICPTSNLFTRKYAKTIEQHPVRAFFDKNLFITVNSDDPALFSTSLTGEYMLLYKNGLFSQDEIVRLIKNNVTATFLPEDRKRAICARIDDAWKAAGQ
ncbi:MAG: adenosine deaminase [Spirochaetaceae bacterium]|jgi:adenosine deaminase|nr:adenosine deaminase [Spirochaetaceae bacterium]